MDKRKRAYTFEELMQRKKEFERSVQNAKKELEEKREAISDIESHMERVMECGDIPKYKELFAKHSDLKLEADVLAGMIRKMESSNSSGFSDEEVRQSWAEVAGEYNGKFAARIKELDNLIATYESKYEEAEKEEAHILEYRDRYLGLLMKRGPIGSSNNFEPIEFLPDKRIV